MVAFILCSAALIVVTWTEISQGNILYGDAPLIQQQEQQKRNTYYLLCTNEDFPNSKKAENCEVWRPNIHQGLGVLSW